MKAASRVRIKHYTAPLTLKEARRERDTIRKDKDAALAAQKYDLAAELREQELQKEENIKELDEGWRTGAGTRGCNCHP